ncbi:MAG: hypothetical protein HC853_01240, partial [Anaerolineae bacterium]|nr:hypothetical protein [Anaerolineae bacterium]
MGKRSILRVTRERKAAKPVEPTNGGQIQLTDRIKLDVSPGAVSQRVVISTEEVIPVVVQSTSGETDLEFPIKLFPDMVFSAPVQLQVNLAGLYNAEMLAKSEGPYLTYWRPKTVTETVDDGGMTRGGVTRQITRTDYIPEDIAAEFDPETGLLTASLNHFSDYTISFSKPAAPEPWKFNVNGGQVGLFRGAVSYQYPINVPAMQDGLQPNIALQYSSASASSKAGHESGNGVGWVVGTGWSMDVPRITRWAKSQWALTIHYQENWDKCKWGLGCIPYVKTQTYDDFTLTLNGQSVPLIRKDSTQAFGDYVTEDYSPLRIMRCNGAAPVGCDVPTSGLLSEYWQVWTPDGVRHVFGVDDNSRDMVVPWCEGPPYQYAPCAAKRFARQWFLRRTYEPTRDSVAGGRWSVQYDYENGISDTLKSPVDHIEKDPNKRPKSIQYGTSLKADGTTPSTQRYQVTFQYAANSNNLSGIRTTLVNTATSTEVTEFRSYQLFSNLFSNNVKTRVVYSITERSGGLTLPPTLFDYKLYSHSKGYKNELEDRPLLRRIGNGYGGYWSYQYTGETSLYQITDYWVTTSTMSTTVPSWTSTRVYAYGGTRCVTTLSSPCTSLFHIYEDEDYKPQLTGFGQVTESLRLSNGSNFGSTVHKFIVDDFRKLGREYETLVYDEAGQLRQRSTSEFAYYNEGHGLPAKSWQTVVSSTVSYPNGAGAYRRQESIYGYGPVGNPTTSIYRSEKPGANGAYSDTVVPFAGIGVSAGFTETGGWLVSQAQLAGMVPVYQCSSSFFLVNDPNGNNASGRGFGQKYNFIWNQSTCKGKGTGSLIGYIYSAGNQPGNAVRLGLQEFSSAASYPNCNFSFPVNRTENTCRFRVVATGGDEIGYAIPIFPNPPSPLSINQLALNSQVIAGKEYTSTGAAAVLIRQNASSFALNGTDWVMRPISETLRDASGALLNETKYYWDNQNFGVLNAKGQLTKLETGKTGDVVTTQQAKYDALGNTALITDALGYTSTASYDSTGNFVVALTNAKGQASQYTYFGVNEAVPIAGQPYGLLRTVRDPNNADTEYRYDALGRLLKVIRPNDSEAMPTEAYDYSDVGGAFVLPFKVLMAQRESNTCGGCIHPVMTYYDGMGRVVQVKSEDSINGLLLTEVNSSYDEMGQKAADSIPQLVQAASPGDATFFGYREPSASYWATTPKTTYRYDALGRTVTVTGTDGVTVTTAYSTTENAVVTRDGMGRLKISESDVLSRLARVKEISGTFNVPTFAVAPYAVTTYTYDIEDKLTRVQDPLGNTTVITYDVLGRKTGMRDPDMGVWSYQYDLGGNLITQTDALGQVLWFKYDPLNRVTEKRQTGSGGPVLAQYTYDAGANGIGRRSTMSNSVDQTSWAYDTRGRVLSEQKVISGTSTPFVTKYDYDSADRIISMTYPSDEVITNAFNNAMQPLAMNSLSYNTSYITQTNYNAFGQPQTMFYGNGLKSRYYYWGVDHNPGGSIPNNWAYGRLRRVCVMGTNTADSECIDNSAGASGNTLLNMDFSYDGVGNITQIRDKTFGANPTVGQRLDFTYDPLDRLVKACTTSSMGSATCTGTPVANGAYIETYGYDRSGNLTQRNGATIAYTATQPHAATSYGITGTYQYDDNGNMKLRAELSGTQRITYTQGWNIDNRLSVVTNTVTNQVSRFFYDADGVRVQRVDPNGITFYAGSLFELSVPALTAPRILTVVVDGPVLTVPLTVPNQIVFVRFQGALSQALSLGMDTVGIPSTQLDWRSNPTSTPQVLSSTLASAGQRLDMDLPPLPYAGWYEFQLRPASAATGIYTLTLSTPLTVSALINGPNVPMTLTRAGQNAILFFTATQAISANVAARTTFTVGARMDFVTPGGATSSFVQVGALDMPLQTLTQTGTYQVLVDPNDGRTGVYTWTLSTPVTGVLVGDGPSLPLTVTRFGQDVLATFTGFNGVIMSMTAATTATTITTLTVRAPGRPPLTTLIPAISQNGLAIPGTAGTSEAILNPGNLATGRYTLTLTLPGFIVTGGASKGITITVPTNTGSLLFYGEQGQHLSFGIAAPGTQLIYVFAYAPSNFSAHFATASGVPCPSSNTTPPLCEFDLPNLPETGVYRITIDPALNNIIGTWTLTLTAASFVTLTADGPSATLAITRTGQDARYNFVGVQGQYLNVGAVGASIAQSTLWLYRPDGTELMASAPAFATSPIAERDLPVLPLDGVYGLVIDPYKAEASGTYTVLLSSAILLTGVVDGPSIPITITRPGQDARILFGGNLGDLVSLGFSTTNAAQTQIDVLKPDGTNHAIDAPNFTANPLSDLDMLALPQSANYLIRLSPNYGNSGNGNDTGIGTYSLTLSSPAFGSIASDGVAVTSTVTRPGQDIRLSFEGRQGESLRLGVLNPGGPSSTNVTVIKPDGALLNAGYSYFPGSTPSTFNLTTLPADGVYTIRLNPGYYLGGNYTTTLTYQTAPTPTPTPTLNPAVCLFTTGVLDNFNRADGVLGGSWLSDTTAFAISTNQLSALLTDTKWIYLPTDYGPDQEAQVRLTNVSTATAVALVLK